MNPHVKAIESVLSVLDRLEIPCEVVGSLASSVHGIPRATNDIDLVVQLHRDRIAELVNELQPEFYADAQMIADALVCGRSFNIIHYATSLKFDLFPLQEDDYSHTQFARRAFAGVRIVGEHTVECAVASAEDTILAKLRGYKATGETSERQWNDLRGILKVSGERLDMDYVNHWAEQLGLSDVLGRLMQERARD